MSLRLKLSRGTVLPLRGQLAIAGFLFACHTSERNGIISQEVEAEDATKGFTIHRLTHQNKDSHTSHVISTKEV